MALKAWEKCSYKGGENGCLGPSNNATFEPPALFLIGIIFLAKKSAVIICLGASPTATKPPHRTSCYQAWS